MTTKISHEHDHTDSKGIIHKCYHECREVFAQWGFWIGVTVSFPIEHFIWEKVPPFKYLTTLIGL
jgi:hypothetical protein